MCTKDKIRNKEEQFAFSLNEILWNSVEKKRFAFN